MARTFSVAVDRIALLAGHAWFMVPIAIARIIVSIARIVAPSSIVKHLRLRCQQTNG